MFIAITIIIILLILGIIGASIVWTITVYNRFVTILERVNNSKAQIATQVESRWDAIGNLISATKHYAKHESETLENVIAKRQQLSDHSSIKDIEENESQLSNVIGRLMAVSERYPELKASEIYINTMNNVNEYEDKVRHSRMIYNDVVTQFNRQLRMFPTNFIGKIFNFKEQDYFEQTETKVDMPSWE